MNDQETAGIAVMMYTVLEPARHDLEGTLERLAGIGYLGIETYGLVEHFGPGRVRDAIAGAGLELTSAHTPFPSGDEAGRILDENETLGAHRLVWSMEREEFDSPSAILTGVERVNDAAEEAARRGMTVVYHNHFAEFSNVFDGHQAYDILLGALDPRVEIELDAYWTRLGGDDPARVLSALGDRATLVHVKDGPVKSYDDDVMVPIGEGIVDWAEPLAAGRALDWHIVELERLDTPVFEALETSYRHLVGRGISRGRLAVDALPTGGAS